MEKWINLYCVLDEEKTSAVFPCQSNHSSRACFSGAIPRERVFQVRYRTCDCNPTEGAKSSGSISGPMLFWYRTSAAVDRIKKIQKPNVCSTLLGIVSSSSNDEGLDIRYFPKMFRRIWRVHAGGILRLAQLVKWHKALGLFPNTVLIRLLWLTVGLVPWSRADDQTIQSWKLVAR